MQIEIEIPNKEDNEEFARDLQRLLRAAEGASTEARFTLERAERAYACAKETQSYVEKICRKVFGKVP